MFIFERVFLFMRVISLVPSITETLFDLGLTTDEIVGRTKFCIHPKELVDNVEIIGEDEVAVIGHGEIKGENKNVNRIIN